MYKKNYTSPYFADINFILSLYLFLYSIFTNLCHVLFSVDPLIHCPVCKKGFPQDSILDNMFICEAQGSGDRGAGASEESFTCTSCTDEAIATGLCTDCSEWLCDQCIQVSAYVTVVVCSLFNLVLLQKICFCFANCSCCPHTPKFLQMCFIWNFRPTKE